MWCDTLLDKLGNFNSVRIYLYVTKLNTMLKQEIYEKASDIFGVSVGVANIMSYTKFEDTKSDYTPVKYKRVSDELDINMIINRVIELGKYKSFQKILHTIHSKTKNRRIKQLTIYKKAWKELTDICHPSQK